MKVRFTKPTMNYAVGDVVDLDKHQKELVDGYIKEYIEGTEADKERYVEVKEDKATKKAADSTNTSADSGNAKK